MSIRLDPRRLGTLKTLAGEAGVRPGDLVRQWIEERIDAERRGSGAPHAGDGLAARVDELVARVGALEAALLTRGSEPEPAASQAPSPAVATEDGAPQAAPEDAAPQAAPEDAAPQAAPETAAEAEVAQPSRRGRPRRNAVSAAPSGERVALHDEMIAVISERGPLTAAELAEAITERGRYAPPRSGKALDAAMVSQRVSNPTYRARFTRSEGRIGLAE